MIFKYFRPKILRKKWHFLLKTKLNYVCIILIITLVFEKNAENNYHNIDPRSTQSLLMSLAPKISGQLLERKAFEEKPLPVTHGRVFSRRQRVSLQVRIR
jgi:hypothetical protein